jgi:tetratricopeptide (TPR) repeat protein
MADLEVENTLREIRERVLSEARARAPLASAPATPPTAPRSPAGAEPGGGAAYASEPLARMDANLATTGRAWSRLPPMLTYRRGAAARLELWLKRLIARAAHWFTWEQVNFNSAVHHALGDARAAMGAHEQALARLRSEILSDVLPALRAEAEADRARVAELASHAEGLRARLAQAEARFESQGAQLRQAFAAGLERLAESGRASTAALREEMRGALREEMHGALLEELRGELGARAESLRAETSARADELHAELRERLDGLLEEQRVCFKQLSLEAGEAAVTHDRARRQLEARLEALEGKK